VKGKYLVRHDDNKFTVDRKGASRCWQSTLTWGNINIANAFDFATDCIVINTNDYIVGYASLSHRCYLPTLLYAEIQHGPVAINKQTITSSLILPDVDVFDNYLIFKNGANIGAYTATGLSNIFQPGDHIIVSYPVNSKLNLLLQTYLLDSVTYGNGYIDTQSVDIAAALIRVSNGIVLVEGVHYIIYNRYIIFKNGVVIGTFISSGITEVLQQDDIIVTMLQLS